MAPATQLIKVGTLVKYKGQRATVVKTVMAKESPSRKLNLLLGTKRYKKPEFSTKKVREERSFIVEIAAPSDKAKRTLLWPDKKELKII